MREIRDKIKMRRFRRIRFFMRGKIGKQRGVRLFFGVSWRQRGKNRGGYFLFFCGRQLHHRRHGLIFSGGVGNRIFYGKIRVWNMGGDVVLL